MKRRPDALKRQEYLRIALGSVSSATTVTADPFAERGRGWPGMVEGDERSDSPVIYLNSNISTEHPDPPPSLLDKLSPYHKKSAYALGDNVSRFCELYGLENCAFLTLTFKENIIDHREASRRFDSLNTHFLSRFYGEWVWARERQKRGAWHYHILIQCKGNIRGGFDWEEYLRWLTEREAGKKGRLKTGNQLLRNLWELNRNAMARYGFGIAHLLPIRSTSEAVGKYVSKYIAKQIGQRSDQDKGVRLTSHSQGFIASSPKFSWNTDGAKLWRKNLALFAQLSCCCRDYDDFTTKAGPKWAFKYRKMIFGYQDHMNDRYPGEVPF